MNINEFLYADEEKPLDRIVTDGGFCRIFRTIGCIGDSLSSGEHESLDVDGKKGYHDYYEYSWGQVMARNIGAKVYNFSRGGMTADKFCESFGNECGFFDKDKLCQCYIIALGVNDMNNLDNQPLGSAEDINLEDSSKNKKTFYGNYAKIIQNIKAMQPKARIFLVGFPNIDNPHIEDMYRAINTFADIFEYTYVLDLNKYGPVYDKEFKKKFFVGGHMNAAGYVLSAQIITSYIDYIIRHNLEEFSQVGFIGTDFHHINHIW